MIDENVRQRAQQIADVARDAGFEAPIFIRHEMFHDEIARVAETVRWEATKALLWPTFMPWKKQ